MLGLGIGMYLIGFYFLGVVYLRIGVKYIFYVLEFKEKEIKCYEEV